MRELGNKVCVLFMSILVVMVISGAFIGTAGAFPQDDATKTPAPAAEPAAEAASDTPVDMPKNVDMASMAAPIDPDSFLTAPNDSSEVAAAIAEMIRKEQAKLQNRIKNSGLGQLYIKGGMFMYPLLACSIIGLVLIFERLWTLSRAHTNNKKLMMDVVKALRDEGIGGGPGGLPADPGADCRRAPLRAVARPSRSRSGREGHRDLGRH